MNETSRLEAVGVAVEYPGVGRVLHPTSLTLSAGELVCVVGPNGAGKSTLLRVLGGLVKPSEGSVLVSGVELRRLGARERARNLASVPQGLEALPHVRVEDFVLGGRYAHLGWFGRADGQDRGAVREALSEVDALDLAERELHALSGGQRQRVLLARALAQEAKVLLCDEPTAALDPAHQVQAFTLLRRLTRDDRAALVATHELSLASRFADRVLLVDAGRVRAAGPVDDVFRCDALEAVYGPDLFLAEDPDVPGRPVVVPWPRSAPGGGPATPPSAGTTPTAHRGGSQASADGQGSNGDAAEPTE